MRDLDDEDRQALTDAISDIFRQIQCLPVVVTPTPKSKGKVWTASQEGIHLLTNPIFYKLKSIGGVPRTLTGPGVGCLAWVKASNVVINRRLVEMHGGSVNADAERRKARRVAMAQMARLSKKTKNQRQPLSRRRKKSPSPEDSDSEDEEDEEDALQEDELEEDELEEDELEDDESGEEDK